MHVLMPLKMEEVKDNLWKFYFKIKKGRDKTRGWNIILLFCVWLFQLFSLLFYCKENEDTHPNQDILLKNAFLKFTQPTELLSGLQSNQTFSSRSNNKNI